MLHVPVPLHMLTSFCEALVVRTFVHDAATHVVLAAQSAQPIPLTLQLPDWPQVAGAVAVQTLSQQMFPSQFPLKQLPSEVQAAPSADWLQVWVAGSQLCDMQPLPSPQELPSAPPNWRRSIANCG